MSVVKSQRKGAVQAYTLRPQATAFTKMPHIHPKQGRKPSTKANNVHIDEIYY